MCREAIAGRQSRTSSHRASTSDFPGQNPAGARTQENHQPAGPQQDEWPTTPNRQSRDAASSFKLVNGVKPLQAARVV
jgi:hypothetical protein